MDRREYWSKHCKLQEASGESQADYCRRTGISATSFSTWRRRIKRGSEAGCFVAVGISEPIELVVGKVVIRVSPGSELSELRRIVDALSC